jgi:hypothetical protein
VANLIARDPIWVKQDLSLLTLSICRNIRDHTNMDRHQRVALLPVESSRVNNMSVDLPMGAVGARGSKAAGVDQTTYGAPDTDPLRYSGIERRFRQFTSSIQQS